MKPLHFLFLILIASLANAQNEDYAEKAAAYLTMQQTPEGQFDDLGVFVTAPAIVALQAVDRDKNYKVIQNGAKFIASKHRADGCISQWCSGQGHIPDETGISLWSLATTNNLDLLPENGLIAIRKIKESQTEFGDFASDEGTNIEHTAWALLSLSATHSLTQEEANKAINYIATHWQEKNGAVKRADDDRSGVNGPQEYYTALTTWALAYANQTNNTVYKLALANLITKSEDCFNNSTNVLTIATAKLALDASNVSNDLETCIWNLQHSNGGFRDSIRASSKTNSFDTAFAVLAASATKNVQVNSINSRTKANPNVEVKVKITAGNETLQYKVNCVNGFECLTKVANVTCTWYGATSGLTCKSQPDRHCFITQVNDLPMQVGSKEWKLNLNGKLSSVGISCVEVENGDEIELVLEEDFNPYTSAQSAYATALVKRDYSLLIIAGLVLISLITLILFRKKRVE